MEEKQNKQVREEKQKRKVRERERERERGEINSTNCDTVRSEVMVS